MVTVNQLRRPGIAEPKPWDGGPPPQITREAAREVAPRINDSGILSPVPGRIVTQIEAPRALGRFEPAPVQIIQREMKGPTSAETRVAALEAELAEIRSIVAQLGE